MKRYFKVYKPEQITKEGLHYCKIDGQTQLCYYWKDIDTLEIITPA